MGEEKKVSHFSLANRMAPVGLPIAGIITTVLWLMISYRMSWHEGIATAVWEWRGTPIWTAAVTGVLLLVADIFLQERSKLRIAAFMFSHLMAAVAGWSLAEFAMNT